MARFILVRHGDTQLNSRERFWGHSDVELSEAGVAQAEKLRDRLAARKISAIYSSELQRALLTAEIIASRHQLDITTCAELREINFGKIEGLTFTEVSRHYPELSELWASWNLELRFPDGESAGELNCRVSKFRDELKKHGPDETVLIVAHAGPLRLLVCLLLELELHHWRQISMGLASLSIVETYPQGAVLSLLNDMCHLE